MNPDHTLRRIPQNRNLFRNLNELWDDWRLRKTYCKMSFVFLDQSESLAFHPSQKFWMWRHRREESCWKSDRVTNATDGVSPDTCILRVPFCSRTTWGPPKSRHLWPKAKGRETSDLLIKSFFRGVFIRQKGHAQGGLFQHRICTMVDRKIMAKDTSVFQPTRHLQLPWERSPQSTAPGMFLHFIH